MPAVRFGTSSFPNPIADVIIETAWDDLTILDAGNRKIFDSGSAWQLYDHDESYLFLFRSPLSGPVPYKAALMIRDYTRGKVLLNRSSFDPAVPVYPLEYPLDELILINHLALGRGVEIHACGLIDSSGRGHLFTGQSGDGKTTMAGLWQDEPGVTVLSDDRIVLRKVDGRIWMYGTPWHGDARLSSPVRTPLTGIYLLRHGRENELVPQQTADAVSGLFARSFVLFYDPAGLSFTLGFLQDVAESVPCHELRFVPDKRVVAFIDDAGGYL